MVKQYRTVNGTQYLYWRGYYWLSLKEIKHDCGKKFTIYKKYRFLKGELKEMSYGARFCPQCTVSY